LFVGIDTSGKDNESIPGCEHLAELSRIELKFSVGCDPQGQLPKRHHAVIRRAELPEAKDAEDDEEAHDTGERNEELALDGGGDARDRANEPIVSERGHECANLMVRADPAALALPLAAIGSASRYVITGAVAR
jgi:hypothetical protein